jgi:hypothetical protein
MRSKYGISVADYSEMYDEQEGKCKICGKPGAHYLQVAKGQDKLCVDHCHDSLEVRGLLCRKCNILIGFADNDPVVLLKAIDYLAWLPPKLVHKLTWRLRVNPKPSRNDVLAVCERTEAEYDWDM